MLRAFDSDSWFVNDGQLQTANDRRDVQYADLPLRRELFRGMGREAARVERLLYFRVRGCLSGWVSVLSYTGKPLRPRSWGAKEMVARHFLDGMHEYADLCNEEICDQNHMRGEMSVVRIDGETARPLTQMVYESHLRSGRAVKACIPPCKSEDDIRATPYDCRWRSR